MSELPSLLAGHLQLTLTALGLGIALGLGLSLLALRVRPLAPPVLGLASVIQTAPSLAMLALIVAAFGRIGFWPAVTALTLYSLLPVVRNTITGVDGVDPALIEAGRGVGMTERQLLLQVQAPLAAPMIIAGVRTGTVWVVGIATLSTPVGAPSLGNFIFAGLQTRDWGLVALGCVSAALLALLLDALIGLGQRAAALRSRSLGGLSAAGVAAVIAGGLAPGLIARTSGDDRPVVVVGAKTFTEQFVLAETLASTLEAAGFRAQTLKSLGSTVVFDALAASQIDVYVEYTGTIWANQLDDDARIGVDAGDGRAVLDRVATWLEAETGVVLFGPVGFENTYAVAIPRDRADALNATSIDDLFEDAPRMKIGGSLEFFARPEWADLKAAYDVVFADEVAMDPGLMYDAVRAGELDVIAAFSTDGRIAAFDLVVLDDPRGVFPPYDAVVLLSPEAAQDDVLRAALAPLLGAVDDDAMRRANMAVDVDGASVEDAATQLRSDVAADPDRN